MLEKQSELTYHESELQIDFTIKDTKINPDAHIETRNVVRGIVIQEDKLLVVYPKQDRFYGTPGGGIEDAETLEEALQREMLEEVGAKDITIKQYLGKMSSYRVDYHNNHTYNPVHHYFLIDINEYTKPQLIEYEQELELTHEFINIDELIASNKRKLQERGYPYLDFYSNQTQLFMELKKLNLFE